jgi:hypothetical protein
MKILMRPVQLFARAQRRAGGLARLLVLCLASHALLSVSIAQVPTANGSAVATEERVKAASLYRFLNYVEWPAAAFATSTSPYVIGVINDDEIADELAAMSAGRNVNNRPVKVKKLQAMESLSGLHVVFVGKAEKARQVQLLKQAQMQSVLSVTETEEALAQGSMINFRIVEDRVRFEVALAPVEKAGMKINSRMLGVAISVIKGAQQ